jgi:hypothetical protein
VKPFLKLYQKQDKSDNFPQEIQKPQQKPFQEDSLRFYVSGECDEINTTNNLIIEMCLLFEEY